MVPSGFKTRRETYDEGTVSVKRVSLSGIPAFVLFLAGTILGLWFVLSTAFSPTGPSTSLSRAVSGGQSPSIPVARLQIVFHDPRHTADEWDCPESHGSLGHLPLWTCSHPFSATLDTSSTLHVLPETTRFLDFLRTGQDAATVTFPSSDYNPSPYRPPARLL